MEHSPTRTGLCVWRGFKYLIIFSSVLFRAAISNPALRLAIQTPRPSGEKSPVRFDDWLSLIYDDAIIN
ncbi:hypothetical protein NC651_032628 [Populus alba x Populus x berolinensis]|nr:hypothetical protein NC651_032628 [Populus alba x Populus x berolinensis]